MSCDEKYHNVKTPAAAITFGARSGQSSMDLQRTVTSGHGNPQLNLNNVTFNGVPALQDNSFNMSSTSSDLPSSIQTLCQNNMNFSLKIVERTYEVQVDDGDIPGILNELNIARPTSIGLDCLQPIAIGSDEGPSETPQKKDNKNQVKVKKEPKGGAAKTSRALKPLIKAAQVSNGPKTSSKPQKKQRAPKKEKETRKRGAKSEGDYYKFPGDSSSSDEGDAKSGRNNPKLMKL